MFKSEPSVARDSMAPDTPRGERIRSFLAHSNGDAAIDLMIEGVDQAVGDDSAQRFVKFLQVLVQNAPGLVLYLDNLESLLIGPEDGRDHGFGHLDVDHTSPQRKQGTKQKALESSPSLARRASVGRPWPTCNTGSCPGL